MVRRRLPPRAGSTTQEHHPLLAQAVALHQTGHLAEAAVMYREILSQSANHFDATHLLGVIALQEERLDEALNLITAALRVNPSDAVALNNLGTVHLRKHNPELACALFDRASKLQPMSISALTNLGTALRQLGRSREALVPLQTAFSETPESAIICNLLGACLLDTGDAAAAAILFESATVVEPGDVDGWSNLAIALNSIGEHERAQAVADKAVAMSPESSSAIAALAGVQFENKQFETALDTYRRAVDLPDRSVQTLCAFGNALWTAGRGKEALEILRLATALDSNNAFAAWKQVVSQCQAFYHTQADLEASRQAFAGGMGSLAGWFRSAHRPEAYAAVASTQPFFIAYQAFNNKQLLSQYGRMCTEWMAAMPLDEIERHRANTVGDCKVFDGDRKIRIGIVSAHIRDHSVWNAITKGWLNHIDKSRFAVSLFHLGHISDGETEQARQLAVHFEDSAKNLTTWASIIKNARLDALIYPEIGMDVLTTQLASLRLAPVQAAAWGHPETTGLPTMDLYLSADGLEPPDAQDNYSERLVCLPNLGVYAEPLSPAVELPQLRSLGLPSNVPLLLCPGTPFKYSPADDVVWARIAKGLQAAKSKSGWSRIVGRLREAKNGRLVFFRSGNDPLDKLLFHRLRNAFEVEKADYDAYVSVIPYLKRSRFFGLMQQSAIMLDTIGFSGFNNAMQALEAGLPVLAREGSFMRGRLASGIVRRIGMPELVATTNEQFIEAAVELALNPVKCKTLGDEVANRRDILFHDLEPVRALERCLTDAIRSKGRHSSA